MNQYTQAAKSRIGTASSYTYYVKLKQLDEEFFEENIGKLSFDGIVKWILQKQAFSIKTIAYLASECYNHEEVRENISPKLTQALIKIIEDEQMIDEILEGIRNEYNV